MITTTFIKQTITLKTVPEYINHNKKVINFIYSQMKKIQNGLFSFDIRVDNKNIVDVIFRDNGKYKSR